MKRDNWDAGARIAAETGRQVTKEEAAKETIAYGILESHNTSGNMDNLKIKFDKLTSHDITFIYVMHNFQLHLLITYYRGNKKRNQS